MKKISVILARGGSKGIPKKNLAALGGMPLIYYSIKASLGSSSEETWVCTDDEEIAEISVSFGAKTLMRPPELCGDESPSEPSLLFFADRVDFDVLAFIQPTSPLLRSEHIEAAFSLVELGALDSVFSAYEEHWIPRWSLCGDPIGWNPLSRPRRQDIPLVLVENGAVYVTKRKTLISTGIRCGGRVGHVLMKPWESVQIDTPDDLEFAERLIHKLF